MAAIEYPQVLLQRWIHSHEEDSPTEMVLRPHTFEFPPSRGRAGYEFHADGTYVDIGIAPGDGPAESAGTWQLDEDRLLLRGASGAQTLRVVSAAADRIVLAK